MSFGRSLLSPLFGLLLPLLLLAVLSAALPVESVACTKCDIEGMLVAPVVPLVLASLAFGDERSVDVGVLDWGCVAVPFR